MNVLLLSPYPDNLLSAIKKFNDEILIKNESVNIEFLKSNNIDFIISYGFKEIINRKVIAYMKNSIINLHISYLPFNRGFYPNLWSHLDGNQSGVSIHIIDEGIDTGKILLRKKISFDVNCHTFSSSYDILKKEIENLFISNWHQIRLNKIKGFKPLEKGTFHFKKEGLDFLKKINYNWDTDINHAINIFKKGNLS